MIDWNRFDELRNEVGEDAISQVVELFLEEVDETIAQLRTACDPARLEELLHFLKGSALNLGFAELGALCETGEKSATDGAMGEIDLGRIVHTYDVSKKEFLAKLGLQGRAA